MKNQQISGFFPLERFFWLMKLHVCNHLQNNIHPFLLLFCFLSSSVISGATVWGPHFLTFFFITFFVTIFAESMKGVFLELLAHTGTPLFSKNQRQKYVHQSNVVSLYWIQFLSKETELVKLWNSLPQNKHSSFYSRAQRTAYSSKQDWTASLSGVKPTAC